MGMSQLKSPDALVVGSASAEQSFDNVKFPIALETPDRTLTRTFRDVADNMFAILNDDYTFQQQTVENDAILECWSGQKLAQKIVVGATGNKVKKLTLTLNRPGATTVGNLTASIYSDVSGSPGASLGASNTVALSTLTQGVKAGYTFTFGAEIVLDPNANYWIVLTSTGDATNKVNWYCRITGADATIPASVYGTAWTNDTSRNMTYILIGYYVDGTIEIPFKLVNGPVYQSIYFNITSDANSSAIVDIVNVDSGVNLYTGLTNGQAVTLDPTVSPNLKMKITLKRDPGKTTSNPRLSSMGIVGKAYASKYHFVDRVFSPTQFSTPSLDMGLSRMSGGVQLLSASGSTLKANSDIGYLDQTTYYVSTTAGNFLTQLFYTAVPIKITGFRMRINTSYADSSFDAGAWTDVSGVPTAAIGAAQAYTSPGASGTSNFAWVTVTFTTPINIPAGYFHLGFKRRVSGSYNLYGAYYNRQLDLNGMYANGAVQSDKSLAMDIYGTCVSANAISTLTLPGVEEHGLLYPLTYKPTGATITMKVTDPVTNLDLITLADGEKCSLALINSLMLSKLKLTTTLNQADGNVGPIAGICYHYTGSEMSPIPSASAKKYRLMKFAPSYLSAVGNYVNIVGKGKLMYWEVNNYYNTSGHNAHKLTIDGTVITWDPGNTSAGTTETRYLTSSLALSTTAQTAPLMIDFNERLLWDLTNYYTTSGQGGVLVVALEVDA